MADYVTTNSIIDAELAGCLPTLNDIGNFKNLKGTLEQHIALCSSMARAHDLVAEIHDEADDVIVPYHEYIINELQYERRVGMAGGIAKVKEAYEQQVLSNWSRSLILRFGTEYTMEFLTMLGSWRSKRTR